jgi:hypothetical protein
MNDYDSESMTLGEIMSIQSETPNTVSTLGHRGPHLGTLAIVYTVLFNAGLYPVTAMAGKPYWPGPWEPAEVIVPYFQTHAGPVLTCLFLQFGATIALGIFTASVVSRLNFLGVRSAGPWIALFGGLLTVFNGLAASLTVWTMIHPSVLQTPSVLLGLYYLSYAFGGPGFSVPMGLFMAGVSVPSAFMKLLPKWVIVLGMILAVAGELSWFHLVSPKALFLIPLVRFPGFIWLIATGFMLPKAVPHALPSSEIPA